MSDTPKIPQRRGRPPGERPPRSSAEKMREARERALYAIWNPDAEIPNLPDSLLFEALEQAFKRRQSMAVLACAREVFNRLNDQLPQAPIHLGVTFGNDLAREGNFRLETRLTDTVSDIVTDTVSEMESPNIDTVTETITDTVSDNPEPFTLAPAAVEPVSARDAEILSRYAAGETKRGIARQMDISDGTVRNVLARHGV